MNPIGTLQRYAILALALIVAGGAVGAWERHQGKREGEAIGQAHVATLTAKYAQATANAEAAARAKEQAQADTIAKIEARHAQELTHAKHDAAGVIAGLKSGNLRLRDEWTACRTAASVPETTASAGQPDATADSRAGLASAVVRVGAEADAQIRALQAIVKADRQEP